VCFLRVSILIDDRFDQSGKMGMSMLKQKDLLDLDRFDQSGRDETGLQKKDLTE